MVMVVVVVVVEEEEEEVVVVVVEEEEEEEELALWHTRIQGNAKADLRLPLGTCTSQVLRVQFSAAAFRACASPSHHTMLSYDLAKELKQCDLVWHSGHQRGHPLLDASSCSSSSWARRAFVVTTSVVTTSTTAGFVPPAVPVSSVTTSASDVLSSLMPCSVAEQGVGEQPERKHAAHSGTNLWFLEQCSASVLRSDRLASNRTLVV